MSKTCIFSDEMTKLSLEALNSRCRIDDIAEIAYNQQSRYTPNVSMEICRNQSCYY